MKDGEEAIVESEKRKREEEALYARELERAAREERSRESLQIIAAGQRARARRALVGSPRKPGSDVSMSVVIIGCRQKVERRI